MIIPALMEKEEAADEPEHPLAEMLVFAVYDWIENRIKNEMAA